MMTTDSFFALTCASTIALFFGSVLAFAGYRFFLFLLPVWGFFWGFSLGAQSIQAIFGSSFLGDVTSWVVGFFLGLLFAALSYLFFAGAVALAAGSLGYTLGVGIMLAIGFDMGLITWLVGVALAIAVIAVTFYLDLYKWIILLATSLMGAGVIVGTFLLIFGKVPAAEFVRNPVRAALNDSPLWWIVFLVVAILGFVAQYMSTRNWTLRRVSQWDEIYPSESAAETVVPASSAGMTSGGLTPASAGASPSMGMAPTTPPVPPPAPSMDVPPAADSSGEPRPGGSA